MSAFLNFNSKLPEVKTTIFTVVGKMANEYKAINLAQGFPDFSPDAKLLGLYKKALNGNYNQYAPMTGAQQLREVIVEKIEKTYGKKYEVDKEVTVTAGATQAIYTAITAFVSKGEEVIVLKPAYDCYEPAIELAGGVPVLIQLKGKEFKIDWEEFRDKITSKTRMVIINTPHNPSGQILTETDILALQDILRDTHIILLSDEVYEHIVFDDEVHQSASRFEDLSTRSIICSSFGKTFHVTGWKVGYCVGPSDLMHEFNKIHQFNVFCVNHPAQIALAEYLQKEEHYLNLNDFYQKKRDYFLNAISGSRFKFTPSRGSYFQLLDYSDITDERDVALNERFIKYYKLASIPMSVFNINERDDKLLRFCFAKTEETLDKAAEILNKI
ncbi:methionine aminotransferase [Flagellimonas sp.]|uniref:methionine aminotransferase n=1 Tax=Flagellimonas sp. TaxID=2058762 RepID=UPI003F4A2C0A